VLPYLFPNGIYFLPEINSVLCCSQFILRNVKSATSNGTIYQGFHDSREILKMSCGRSMIKPKAINEKAGKTSKSKVLTTEIKTMMQLHKIQCSSAGNFQSF
jgi:hypothetical protein